MVMYLYVYCLYAISNYFRHVAMLQKFAGPLVGAPVRPNMLNMPKSASGYARPNMGFWRM